MNQITQMFKDSNERMRQLMNSKNALNLEVIASAQREFEGQIKLVNAVVSAYGIASKNKRALTGLERMNLMDDTTAIDLMLGNPEEDKIKCPERDDLILRAECLDYSGTHAKDCEGCYNFKVTRDRLLGKQDE